MNQVLGQQCSISVGIDETPKEPPKKCKTETNTCPECAEKFKNINKLRKHIKGVHPDKASQYKLVKTYDFNCEQCGRRFNVISNYRRHMRNVHSKILVVEKSHKCPVCSEEVTKRSYIEHLTQQHKINIETEIYAISSYQTFLRWKEDLERETMSKFLTERTYPNSRNPAAQSFTCHRSGYFQSKTRGIRKSRREGSKKINTLCPASLKVYVNSNGTCEVIYIKTHVGHDTNLKHLYLTQSERTAIAEMLSKNIPYDKILSDVKGAVTEQDRLYLLKRQDLRNIATSFGISVSNSQDDNNSVVCGSGSDSSSQDFPEGYVQEVIIGDEDKLNHACQKSRISTEVEKLKQQYLTLLDSVSSKYQLEFMQKEFSFSQATIEAMQSDSPGDKVEKVEIPIIQKTITPFELNFLC